MTDSMGHGDAGMADGDATLLAAAQRGERGALDAFVKRHDRWVRHVVYSTLGGPTAVDDVAQHVWTRVWQQVGTLSDRDRWRAWLFRIARNAAIDAGQKMTRERNARAQLKYLPADRGDDDPAVRLDAAEQNDRVLRAIHGLPPIYREPFILRHLEEWSYAEIAEAMSMPVDTVETRLVRARRLLRDALADLNTNANARTKRAVS